MVDQNNPKSGFSAKNVIFRSIFYVLLLLKYEVPLLLGYSPVTGQGGISYLF